MSKYCNNCGIEIIDDMAAVCPGCGAAQTQDQSAAYQQAPPPQQMYSQPYTQPYAQPYMQPFINPYAVEEHTSILGWIGWLILCSYLPIIGHIIMVCTAKNKSTKNFAWAYLIFYIIAIIFVAILFEGLASSASF